MRKFLIISLAALCIFSTRMSAQVGFNFGNNFEFISSKAPSGYSSSASGIGPYAGIIYGAPLNMSTMFNIGLNYKYDILHGASGAWDNSTKLDPFTLLNIDTDIREQHLQLPITLAKELGSRRLINISAGAVLDYCLSSKITSSNKSWPFITASIDGIADLKIKPFNAYVKAGVGVGLKGFAFNLVAAYGLLDLSSNGNSLRRWSIGIDMHINL